MVSKIIGRPQFCCIYERLSAAQGANITMYRPAGRPLAYRSRPTPAIRAPEPAVWRRTPSDPRRLFKVRSMVQRETSMKALINVSALFLSMILALIPFAVIAVNDSAAVRAESIQTL
jgi:hypothetical protein